MPAGATGDDGCCGKQDQCGARNMPKARPMAGNSPNSENHGHSVSVCSSRTLHRPVSEVAVVCDTSGSVVGLLGDEAPDAPDWSRAIQVLSVG